MASGTQKIGHPQNCEALARVGPEQRGQDPLNKPIRLNWGVRSGRQPDQAPPEGVPRQWRCTSQRDPIQVCCDQAIGLLEAQSMAMGA